MYKFLLLAQKSYHLAFLKYMKLIDHLFSVKLILEAVQCFKEVEDSVEYDIKSIVKLIHH
jgi:hypothetical protein